MSKLKTLKEILTSGYTWFSVFVLALLVFLHIGLFKLSELIAGLSFIDSSDFEAIKWVSFVVLEISFGFGLSFLIIWIWVMVMDKA